MKIIAKFNFGEKKKLGISFLSIFIGIGIIGILIVTVYKSKIKDFVKEEAILTLKNVSSQNVLNIEDNISSKQNVVNSLAKNIESDKNFNIENIIEKLKLYSETNGFYNMGIIDKNGVCYTTFDEKLDLSKYDYFINGMKGIGGISNGYISEDKKQILNIFTAPIYKNNKVEMILTATYESSDFSKLINISSFEKYGKTMVIDSSGKLVSQAENIEKSNYLSSDEIDYDKKNISKIISKNINGNEGVINYEYEGKMYISYYEKVNINDWYLVTYVPKNCVYKNVEIIDGMILGESIVIYGSVLLLLFLFFMEYIKYQKKISNIVFYDNLTKEKNYQYLKLYFENMNQKSKEEKYLVVMDIDKFKSINVMHGSEVGDEILKYIPCIFKEVLPNDEIFRYQADIFVAILNGKSEEEIREKVYKIKKKIKQDIEEKLIVTMGLSFGVCNFGEFDDLHSIYNNALISKNEIKGNIKDKINFFNEDSKNKIIENRKIEAQFMDALKDNEFEVWYQPKYYMNTNKVCGAEALVRWRKKDGKLVSPAKFIPVLENSGQIIELDKAVIEMTFKNIKEMKSLGLEIKPVSINLSRVHVECLRIIEEIKELKEKYKIDSKYVSFEITESALIENNDLINKIILEIHKMGFEVNIDDYGIGNSTLNSLYSSEFDILKLDKSFIDNIGDKKMDTIIKSTISMANELKMKIVAEGVETKEQVDFLIENDCNIAQGYYFSKPLDKLSYFELLK